MNDLLLDHQDRLAAKDLIDYARQLSLDVGRFTDELRTHAWRDRIAADIESATSSPRSVVPFAPHAQVLPSHP